LRLCAVALFGAALAGAQSASPVPVIPTDHFGPPVCRGAHAPAHRATYDAQKAEQAQGAVLDHALPSAEPLENFGLQRIRLADYGDCIGSAGCYWADLDAQYRRAELALQGLLEHRRTGEKLALVLDIDETTLSSYCEMKREDFGYIPAMSNAWVVTPDAAVAVPGALRLYKQARASGVKVFFITGRPGKPPQGVTDWGDQTEGTRRNLESAGFRDWAGLALRNGPENRMSTIEYKASEREQITRQGYRILLSVGDQWSDLLGTPQAEVSVKLPNPFYFIP
jgi:hypothetical protein